MNNYLSILSLTEDKTHRMILTRGRDEAGINAVFDPESGANTYQVFIHNRLPFREKEVRCFESFSAARQYTATHFNGDWQLHVWDMKVERPCEKGGYECGSGTCDTCKSTGGCGDNASGSCGR